MNRPIHFISAGAGSGKTFRLTELLYEQLKQGVKPSGVIATTFTKKAAAELRERVRQKLVGKSEFALASSIGQARIGTVNGICGQLVERFAFELGLPPDLEVLEEDEADAILREALASVLDDPAELHDLNQLAYRLGEEDWQGRIKKLVDLARSNDIDPEKLKDLGDKNADDLLANYPKAASASLAPKLVSAMEDALPQLKTAQANKPVKTTQACIDFLEECLRDHQHGALPWAKWVKLGKTDPAKALVPLVEPVHDLAKRHDEDPGLHADIREWLQKAFNLASQVLTVFAKIKRERGVIDFVDQELLLLKALRRDAVQATLRDELQLLLVDEFQDTSPIQLAVFARLASMAGQTIWVGDVKQAIYGFRGSDTALMQAVLEWLPKTGGTRSDLPISYRSRPELVELINTVFVPAFSDRLSAGEVRLSPNRQDRLPHEAFAWWQLAGGNKAEIASTLGGGLRSLLESGYTVIDKQSGQQRAVEPGDIAVLSRSNDGVAAVAAALSEQGLPVAVSQAGLLATPEAVLALACLRRLNDRRDTLASAEIISLTECGDAEVWLADRLRFMEKWHQERGEDDWREVGDNASPVLSRLATLRCDGLGQMTPSEALRRVIVDCDLTHYLLQWSQGKDRAKTRLANLDALRQLAQDYEKRCHSRRRAATIAGLILWFQQSASDGTDILATPQGSSIRVLTHHAAKGLEWPVVVCLDLHAAMRDRRWDASVHSNTPVDIDDPLRNREIRYWPWPYGKQSTGIPAVERIAEGDLAARFAATAREEARRLLYVSMTRARDLLVFAMPAKEKKREWLTCLDAPWLELEAEQTTIDGMDGQKIHVAQQTFEVPVATDHKAGEQTGDRLAWFVLQGLRPEFLPASCSPSSLIPTTPGKTVGGELHRYGKRLALHGKPDMAVLGEALHACIAFDWLNPGLADRTERISAVLRRWGMDKHVVGSAVADGIQRFREYCIERWKPKATYVEYPVETTLENGQRLKGRLDLLLETENGWVIIDHKSNPAPSSEWLTVAQEYVSQLGAYAQALDAVTELRTCEVVINFTIGGGVIETNPTA